MTLDELLYTANQRAIKLEAELTAARTETTQVLSELIACQDQRAALRVQIELLKIQVAQLTTCDCGLPLSTGKCGICDNDE